MITQQGRVFARTATAVALLVHAWGCHGDAGQGEPMCVPAPEQPRGVLAKRMPGSAIVDFTWPTTPALVTQLEYTISVVDDPGAATNYYWSTTFEFRTVHGNSLPTPELSPGNAGGYGGIQTADGILGGRNVIFAFWDAATGEAQVAVDTAPSGSTVLPGAYCERFGGEGSGGHCLAPFSWGANKQYRVRVQQVSSDGARYHAFIIDESETPSVTWYVGTLTAPTGVAGFGGYSAQFVERFTETNLCSALPYARARLSAPSNGGSTFATHGSNWVNVNYCRNAAGVGIASSTDHYLESGTPSTRVDRVLESRAPGAGWIRADRGPDGACGGGGVSVLRASYDECARVTEFRDGPYFVLQSENGLRFRCSTGTVSASGGTITDAERFTRTGTGPYSFKNVATGTYLSVVSGVLKCDAATDAGDAARFSFSTPPPDGTDPSGAPSCRSD